MNRISQLVYNALPPRLRSIPASLHGCRLRRWRYGMDTDRLVEQTLRRETWTCEKWSNWQAERLEVILQNAVSSVPHYRAYWQARQETESDRAWQQLKNWPVLGKAVLRQDPSRFLTEQCNPRRMYREHTSGTTGTPLNLWQSRRMLQKWYALFEARSRRWYGVSRHDRWAILGGQLVTPIGQKRPPYWVWNSAFHQLYLSSYHMSPDSAAHYVRALRRHRVTYLLGYSSALYELALGVLDSGQHDLHMKVAITNAEPLFDYQRQAISEAFDCPVRETYGMSEYAAAAGECEAGRMHLWPDVGIVEVMEDGKPVPAGTPGELVVTGLLNEDMPLIRYRVGDRGVLAPEGTACPCGRTLPVLESIEGRTDDVLHTPDGRRIGRLDPVFKVDLPIREAQIIQETLECLRVRYVPVPGFTAAHGQDIIEHLKARMGDIEVVLEEVPRIPRTANGKFRAVICKIPSPPRESDHSQPVESGTSSEESCD